jgi:uroporphyrin-III C-methyltransferase/precorrin-2 dehydrogenase/sirohydrochlorin ferrochelatase
MHEHTQPLMPTLTDLAGALLLRVTKFGRALLRPKHAGVRPVTEHARAKGHVSLVGAGPGEPELLTLKALKALAGADVVLHDQLVSAEVLALAHPCAQRIDVGKKGYGRACRQGDINALMVAFARARRRVVRLKAGDPLMFGRLEEEIAALEAAGISFDIVPGISAAQGAAASLGVPLTRRRGARRFQAITGHADNGRLPADFDWAGLADPKATMAVYMPKATIGDLCRALVAHGLAADHPAVAVFNATRATEVVLAADVATLPQRLAAARVEGPCIVLIGVAAARRAASLAHRAAVPAGAEA